MAKITNNAESIKPDDGIPETLVTTRVNPDPEASGDDDRRRAERARVTVRIDYGTVDEMFSEFTRDINEGGLFIETEKPHQPGTEVSMQFHLPGGTDALQTIGRVVRVSSGTVGMPAGMGIEFDELTAADRVKIDQIVRALRSSGKA